MGDKNRAVFVSCSWLGVYPTEEKERGLIEDIVHLLLVIASAATIWQFSHQPVTFADVGVMHAQKVAALLRS